jgi:hypothetical protein
MTHDSNARLSCVFEEECHRKEELREQLRGLAIGYHIADGDDAPDKVVAPRRRRE